MQDADDFDAVAGFTIKNQVVSDRKEAHARFASGSTPSAITKLEKSGTHGRLECEIRLDMVILGTEERGVRLCRRRSPDASGVAGQGKV
jgi:hypothetical protein